LGPISNTAKIEFAPAIGNIKKIYNHYYVIIVHVHIYLA
jgi:hypothetical protein